MRCEAILINGKSALSRSVKLSELDGVDVLNSGIGDGDDVGGSRLGGDSLALDEGSVFLELSLDLVVGVDAVNEGSSGSGHADVLDTDMESLGDDTATNTLVDDDSDGVLGNIEDDASLSVVELEGHTLLDGTVGNDINVISLLVGEHHLVHGGNTVLSEGSREKISCSSSLSETMGHIFFKYIILNENTPFLPIQ